MRDVAIVAVAQAPNRPHTTATPVEMIVPVVTEVLARAGLERRDVGFWCHGSCDYMSGQPFSFVAAVDALGAWPPIVESHVEMDGAWALYEAWMKIQTGECDTAVVFGNGKSSSGDMNRALALQLDPYVVAPLWPDERSLAALQARSCLEAGVVTETAMAEVAVRSRRDALANPNSIMRGDHTVTDLLATAMVTDPLREHDCPTKADGVTAVVIASADAARRLSERPAWIRAIDHRIDHQSLGLRSLIDLPAARLAGAKADIGDDRLDVAELHAPFTHQELLLRIALSIDSDRTAVNPSGGALCANPLMAAGLARLAEAASRIHDGSADRGARSRQLRPVPAAAPRLCDGRRLMAERCAVIGVGQTHHTSCRADVSIAGLVREAVDRALAGAHLTMSDIDAIVIGKAPDMLEGVMMPELWLTDALAAAGKPMFRVHTAGSVGGSTAIVAAQHVMAGLHERVLTIGFEKQSDGNAMWALSVPLPFGMPVHAGAGGYFSPLIRSYIRRSAAPAHIGAMVAVKDRTNACKNPYAHLQEADWTLEKAMESPMLWDPIRFVETCPSSDGAIALVLANEAVADAHDGPAAWVQATSMRSEPTMFPGRNQISPRAGEECAASLWSKAGITSPVDEIDAVEMYVPFAWFEPMWLENLGFAPKDHGWRFVEDGATEMSGRLPVNPSGGVLSSNPIGASGMLRFGEAALQVMGTAGEHQIDAVRRAVGHAYGGGSQFFAMWVVGTDKP